MASADVANTLWKKIKIGKLVIYIYIFISGKNYVLIVLRISYNIDNALSITSMLITSKLNQSIDKLVLL